MIKKYQTLGLLFLLGAILHNSLMACTISMGYRSNERLPLINKQPLNTGLYQHLYTLAAKKINCYLKVIRGPKKRILKSLYKGKIDFYPGFNFTLEREENVFYIENGLPGGDVGVSLLSLDNVTDLKQLKGLTLLSALGAANHIKGIDGIKERKVRELTVNRAIALILKKRGDFYIYNKSSIEYYLIKQNIKSIKIHPNCCGGISPLYLAFSKNSPHYQQEKNPNFNKDTQISINNNPFQLNKTSIAYKFKEALLDLKQSGKTSALYNEYYK